MLRTRVGKHRIFLDHAAAIHHLACWRVDIRKSGVTADAYLALTIPG